MFNPTPGTEAAKPRTLNEHNKRAEDAYLKIGAYMDRNVGKPGLAKEIETLVAAARAGFWFWPIVEARVGKLAVDGRGYRTKDRPLIEAG